MRATNAVETRVSMCWVISSVSFILALRATYVESIQQIRLGLKSNNDSAQWTSRSTLHLVQHAPKLQYSQK